MTSAAGVYIGMTRGREHNLMHMVAEAREQAREPFVAAMERDRADRGLEDAAPQFVTQMQAQHVEAEDHTEHVTHAKERAGHTRQTATTEVEARARTDRRARPVAEAAQWLTRGGQDSAGDRSAHPAAAWGLLSSREALGGQGSQLPSALTAATASSVARAVSSSSAGTSSARDWPPR